MKILTTKVIREVSPPLAKMGGIPSVDLASGNEAELREQLDELIALIGEFYETGNSAPVNSFDPSELNDPERRLS